MKLLTVPQNEAVMSNVNEIGEFRIRNSAKAFSILSSGLYANKIRAIVRELSCNAYDSHVAANKKDVPFEVHLPNRLNPNFSVRDFGTGLDHDQVTNIYTTYFESTKSNSNDFIGALGLGSKSPFSYTDNFTVTAIKNGIKGIYTAFINDQGVPSIALMSVDSTDEPTGVEVKFAVPDDSDYYKFKSEAATVLRFFDPMPIISGQDLDLIPVEYEDRDIIPGVHLRKVNDRSDWGSKAVMGNIVYPISVPNWNHFLLDFPFEFHFGIGELDFQASREGLSYIPQTIDAIKNKIEQLENALENHFKNMVDSQPTMWEKVRYVRNNVQRSSPYYNAAYDYITNNPTPRKQIHQGASGYGIRVITADELAKKFNIILRGVRYHPGTKTKVTTLSTSSHWANGDYVSAWSFQMGDNYNFYIQDTKVGAIPRLRHKVLQGSTVSLNYLLVAADSKKPMKTDRFFDWLGNPGNVAQASTLPEAPKKERSLGTKIPVLKLTETYSSRDGFTWVDAGDISTYDKSKTHYYIPMSGFTPLFTSSKYNSLKDIKSALNNLDIDTFKNVEFYGVRKAGLEHISKYPNWVNLQDAFETLLNSIRPDEIEGISQALAGSNGDSRIWNRHILAAVTRTDSPYSQAYPLQTQTQKVTYNSAYMFMGLLQEFAPKIHKKIEKNVDYYREVVNNIKVNYPLLKHIRYADTSEIAAYINLVDNTKE